MTKKILITISTINCDDRQIEIVEDRVEELKRDLEIILDARFGNDVGLGLIEYEVEDDGMEG